MQDGRAPAGVLDRPDDPVGRPVGGDARGRAGIGELGGRLRGRRRRELRVRERERPQRAADRAEVDLSVEVGRRGPDPAGQLPGDLLVDVAVVGAGAVVSAHGVPVDQVDVAVLARPDGELSRDPAGVGHVRQEEDAAGADVHVAVGVVLLVVGREVVGHRQTARRGELDVGVAVILAGGVERAVGRDVVDVARGVGGEPVAAVPERVARPVAEERAGRRPVGVDVQDRGEAQVARVEAHNPPGVGGLIAVRGPPGVDHAVGEEQRVALGVLLRVEDHDGPVAAGALARVGDRRVDRLRRDLVRAGGDVHGVEALEVGGGAPDHLLAHRDEIDRAGGRVDHRGVGDPDHRRDLVGAPVVGRDLPGGQDGRRGARGSVVPEDRAGVGVEGVEAVVLGRDIQDVVDALAGDRHAGHVERLGVDLAVDAVDAEQAERARLDVRRRQDRLARVQAVARGVVVIGQDIGREQAAVLQRRDSGPETGRPAWRMAHGASSARGVEHRDRDLPRAAGYVPGSSGAGGMDDPPDSPIHGDGPAILRACRKRVSWCWSMDTRRAYQTDLTDAQWAQVQRFIPAPKPGGRPAKYARREIINAILYLVRSGCQWRMPPHEFPPGSRSTGTSPPGRRTARWTGSTTSPAATCGGPRAGNASPPPRSSTANRSRRPKKGGPRLRRR